MRRNRQRQMPDTEDYVGENFGDGEYDPSEDASPALFDEGWFEVEEGEQGE
jgi:hypothetical protein